MMKTSIHLEGTGDIKETLKCPKRIQCPAFPQVWAADLNSVRSSLALINLQATLQNASQR
jgi:hypothetical protein